MRIRSTTSVRLLHGLVLLPSGISSKMTATLDLTTIIDMLVASFYRYAALPIFYSSSLPKLPCQALTFSPFLANRYLAMLPLCSAPLIALLVAGKLEISPWWTGLCWDITISLILINASIYFVKGGKTRPYAWCFVPLLPP